MEHFLANTVTDFKKIDSAKYKRIGKSSWEENYERKNKWRAKVKSWEVLKGITLRI